MEGLVYLLFMQERTQKEASEYIYDKEYDKINLQTFRRAREQLLEDGYLESGESKRNTKYRSKVNPLVQKTDENYREHKEEGLSEKQKEALHMIYDSDWFRSFFSTENIEKLWNIKRKDDSNRLTFTDMSNAMVAIGQVLKDASGFSSRLHPIRGYTGPSLAEITRYDSFDDYIEELNWFMREIESYVECWREALKSQDIEPFPPMQDKITRHEVFKIVCEGHNIPEGDEIDDEKKPSAHLKLIFNLVYETELLFQLPYVADLGVPGRKHSRFYVMSSDLRSRIKDAYLISDVFEEDLVSVLNDSEEIFSNEERLKDILETIRENGYEIKDDAEVIDFLQDYQEHGLPYLNW